MASNQFFCGLWVLVLLQLSASFGLDTALTEDAVSKVIAQETVQEVVAPLETETVVANDGTATIPVIENLFPDTHYEERVEEIGFVMVHFSSDVMANPDDPYVVENVLDIFLDYGVSIHYLIDREGVIYQCVNEGDVAWHAGKGSWGDDMQYENRMNQYSIGIELLAIGTAQEMSLYMIQEEYDQLDQEDIGFTQLQYEALAELLEDIVARNDGLLYDRDHIIGHSEYSVGTKVDPGDLFDWSQIGLWW